MWLQFVPLPSVGLARNAVTARTGHCNGQSASTKAKTDSFQQLCSVGLSGRTDTSPCRISFFIVHVSQSAKVKPPLCCNEPSGCASADPAPRAFTVCFDCSQRHQHILSCSLVTLSGSGNGFREPGSPPTDGTGRGRDRFGLDRHDRLARSVPRRRRRRRQSTLDP